MNFDLPFIYESEYRTEAGKVTKTYFLVSENKTSRNKNTVYTITNLNTGLSYNSGEHGLKLRVDGKEVRKVNFSSLLSCQ